MNTITSGAWWKAAVIRALRTALVIAIPYVGGVSLLGIPWLTVASAAGFGALASLVTSLAGLPEVNGGTHPIGLALLERVTKTAAQAIVSGIGTAVLFQDVAWSTVLQAAAIASFGSLLIGVLGFLPESTLAAPLPAIVGTIPDNAKVVSVPVVLQPAPISPAAVPDPVRPSAKATKDAWVAYAKALGVADAETATKAQLITETAK